MLRTPPWASPSATLAWLPFLPLLMTNQWAFSGSFWITVIIIHPLTTSQLLHGGPLVVIKPVISLARVTPRLISWLLDVNWSNSRTYALFKRVGGMAKGSQTFLIACFASTSNDLQIVVIYVFRVKSVKKLSFFLGNKKFIIEEAHHKMKK